MATIVIHDLEREYELDKQALKRIAGGSLGGYNWQGNFYAPLMGSMQFSPQALAYGQAMGNYWGSRLSAAQHYGSSSLDFLGTLQDIVSWASSPIVVNGQRIY
ncbi:hypothetical protein Nhal_3366 [Nitrosococcus halophilus Nc 4]|uniref:Uncharacterized protein n=1 Tax=Nitrosococcus halophilus (strain Nc4) TaxID=472759 RepID=D5C0S8_NITHN|nr:hypothetical protein [Nitrosococcus halophilus]ADE16401.1 hypothetical protein Nhal_3366 [Nitrosococcus halophilus Nc 4]